MEVLLMRKLASLTLALIVAGGVMIAMPAPASAAAKISNGVACKKLNQTTSVSGSRYTCAKNPLVSSTKLTWLSKECLDMASLYLKNKKILPTIKTSAAARIAEIDIDLKKAQADLLDLNTNGPGKIALLQPKLLDAQTKLAASKVATVKNQKTIDAWQLAVTNYQKAIADLGPTGVSEFQRAINRLTIYKTTAQQEYDGASADVTDALGMAKIICAKGF
jgi:hypothetical protein